MIRGLELRANRGDSGVMYTQTERFLRDYLRVLFRKRDEYFLQYISEGLNMYYKTYAPSI